MQLSCAPIEIIAKSSVRRRISGEPCGVRTANICSPPFRPAKKQDAVTVTSRSAVRVFVALATGAVLAASAATGAVAIPLESPTPTPTTQDSVVTYYGPDNWVYDDGDTATYDQTFGVDCSSGVCLLFGYAEELRMPRVEVVDGRATFDVPAEGALCSDEYQWANTTTVEFAGTTATLTQVSHGTGIITCPNGTRNQYIGVTSTSQGTLVSGNPCFITRTCPTPEPTASPTPIAVSAPASPPAPSRAVDDPGVLSALPTVAAAVSPHNALWATAMAVILVLLLAFPTQLLNSAVEAGSERLAHWGEKFANTARGVGPRWRAMMPRVTSVAGWRAAAIGIAAAAIISSFVDPGFGLNAASIRTFVSILISLAIQIVAGWLLLVWVVRRTHPTATAEFEFRPLTLLIVVVAVILTRVTGFEPGIIFGLVAGVGFGALLATAERARVALIGLALAFALSVLAWIGYSLLSILDSGGPVVVFLSETLSSLAIAGIAALPIALVPIGDMTGRIIWKWNRWVWMGAYAVGLFGFFLILMPMPFSWEEVPLSLPVWTGLFVAYAVGAVIVWALIVRPWRKAEGAEAIDGHQPEQAATESGTTA